MTNTEWITSDKIVRHSNAQRTRGLALSTVNKYAEVLSTFVSSHGLAASITPQGFMDWVTEGRMRGQSANTLSLYLAAGKSFAKWQGTGYDELSGYRLPPKAEPQPHPLPNGMMDVRAMLAQCADEPRARMAVALGGLAGLRVAETVAAKATDIVTRTDHGERYLVLMVKGKGEKVREVPISDELAKILSSAGPGSLTGLTNSGARSAITRIAAKAGVVGNDGGAVSSHDMRATFATALYRATSDIVMVQRALGHSSVATTQRYIGSDVARTRAAVNFT